MARAREDTRKKLFRLSEEDGNGCWLWIGPLHSDGYGSITIGRRSYRAHRVAYKTFVGEIPAGLFVCHKCDTPKCINPSHLFVGTAKDNSDDMWRKGRRKIILRGEDHPNTKIAPKEHANIISMRKAGLTLKQIADKYNVSFQHIGEICSKREAR